MSEMKISEEAFLQRQSQFWNDIAQNWSLQNRDPVVGWWNEHESFPEYDTLLFRGIELTGDEIALDYATGPGRNIVRFNKIFHRIDGVDIAPGCIEKAKLNLTDARVPLPNLWVNDGKSLPMIPDSTYDVVFCTIAMQHITSWSVRQNLYKEFFRILKSGGYFTFQTGCGSGHPRSVSYDADVFETDGDFVNKDFRVENVELLERDILSEGFGDFDYLITRTCKDEHENWIWVRVRKPI